MINFLHSTVKQFLTFLDFLYWIFIKVYAFLSQLYKKDWIHQLPLPLLPSIASAFTKFLVLIPPTPPSPGGDLSHCQFYSVSITSTKWNFPRSQLCNVQCPQQRWDHSVCFSIHNKFLPCVVLAIVSFILCWLFQPHPIFFCNPTKTNSGKMTASNTLLCL